jgi:signal peptidase I
MKRLLRRLLVLLVVLGMLWLVWRFVASPFVVVGDSMTPTLQSWDLCLMRRVHQYQPQRGDIVVFRTADDPPLFFVKRVVGLPGETVAIENGAVVIDNRPLPEPYTTLNPGWEMPAVTVSNAQVFVLGDNRDVPLDLTVYGPVATRLVKARLAGHWRWRK